MTISMETFVNAAAAGKLKRIQQAIAGGIDVNGAAKDGSMALGTAVEFDEPQVVCALLEAGAEVNAGDTPPLFLACEQENIEIARLLVAAQAKPDESDLFHRTPLMAAAASGNVEMVEMLLMAGAQPNLTDCDGDTALMWAVRRGASQCVSSLLRHGADPNIRNEDGRRAEDLLQPWRDIEMLLKGAGTGEGPVRPN